MKAIEVGLRNPYLVLVVVLGVIVVGVTAMTRIPADLLPQFDTPAVHFRPRHARECRVGYCWRLRWRR